MGLARCVDLKEEKMFETNGDEFFTTVFRHGRNEVVKIERVQERRPMQPTPPAGTQDTLEEFFYHWDYVDGVFVRNRTRYRTLQGLLDFLNGS